MGTSPLGAAPLSIIINLFGIILVNLSCYQSAYKQWYLHVYIS